MNLSLITADGLKLRLREWSCPGARGTVLLVHGLGEHVGRYTRVAAWLNARQWRVVGHDQRGHGLSEGGHGKLVRDDDLLVDLAAVVDAVRQAHPGPLVLLGHSMGGLVAARFCAEGMSTGPAPWYRAVDALVLSSPALEPGLNAAQKLLLAALGPLAPNLALNNGLNPDWISRDPAVVQAYVDDPLVHDRVSPRLVRFIVDAGQAVRGPLANWNLPTLLLWAGADRIVSPAGSAAFAEATPSATVSAREFPALFHEIFNEPERDEVFATMGTWFDGLKARL
ncbi:MAG: lysophospholipase [Rhizobacter sp.]|nr:lysophospholipase [Rhizobacter sp.]